MQKSGPYIKLIEDGATTSIFLFAREGRPGESSASSRTLSRMRLIGRASVRLATVESAQLLA
jgi:hypothetical protein